jgi:hypothetical protein
VDNDSDSLARVTEKMLGNGNPAVLNYFGEAARKRAGEPSILRPIRKMLFVYKEVDEVPYMDCAIDEAGNTEVI